MARPSPLSRPGPRLTSGLGPPKPATSVSFGGHEGTEVGAALDARPPTHVLASTDPTTGDDDGDGHIVGCRWINESTGEEFVAVDVSTGAAVWESTTAGGGGGTLEVAEADGSPDVSGVDRIEFAASGDASVTVTNDGGGQVTVTVGATGGSGGGDDPIADIFGTPDTAYEFDTTSLSGLTQMATAGDTEDSDTTVPGHLFLRRNATATYRWIGRYVTPPSTPYTVMTKVSAMPRSDYNKAALFIGVATPGDMDLLCYIHNSFRGVTIERCSQTAFSSTPAGNTYNDMDAPVYLAIRANSGTSFDYLWSPNGRVWRTLLTARNPSLTIASVGLAVNPDSNSNGMSAAFDFLRIWNSALTFPGV